MTELKPAISRRHRLSAIWIIPLITLVIGVSLVVRTLMAQGPVIMLDFVNADGLEAGRTKVKLLNVDVGFVHKIKLKNDMSGVTAIIKLKKDALSLLHEDTRFWVVRPRFGTRGVSGLETIVAGSYIEIAPGVGLLGRLEFVGLEEPPITSVDAPGRRLTLLSNHAGSIRAGNPILYKGYKVGRIETMTFDAKQRQVRYDAFVDAPFHELIDSATRFWNTSGISVSASAGGLEVQTGSLDTVLLGGVEFGWPPESSPGKAVDAGREFKLYDSYNDMVKNPFRYGVDYVVSFKQTMHGLVPGAPVEYRGIKVGQVKRILFKELVAQRLTGEGKAIPVLIHLEAGRLELPDNENSIPRIKNMIGQGVHKGLRATLQTGNLLTGQQRININYFPEEGYAELGKFEQYAVIPSVTTGVQRMGTQVEAFLDKLNALPLSQIMMRTNKILGESDTLILSVTEMLDSVNNVLGSEDVKVLPAELEATLVALRHTLMGLSPESQMSQNVGASVNSLNATLENLDALIRQISKRPSSILLPTSPESDPVPEARRQ